MSDSDDDSPQLSAHTLAALQDFYKEQNEIENHLQRAKESGDVAGLKLEENWVSLLSFYCIFLIK